MSAPYINIATMPTVSSNWTVEPPTSVVTEDTDDYPTVPAKPNVSTFDTSGAPPEYTGSVVSNTTWPEISILIPTVPDFDLPVLGRSTDPTAPSIVTEDGETTDIEESVYDTIYNPETREIRIPVPPSIELQTNLPDVPDFTIDRPVDDLNWVYNNYESDLMNTLYDTAVSLLTQDIPISSDSLVILIQSMWNTGSRFLSSRGIEPLRHRESNENQLYRNNVNRLVDILEASYRDKNDKNYVTFMQSVENLKLDMYDARKTGQLSYAKEFATVKLMEYDSMIKHYNAMLDEYRGESNRYLAQIKQEQARLTKYQLDIEAYRKKGELNSQLIREYLSQISVVNTIVDSYKKSMEVAKSVANITVLSTEINNLNAQNAIFRARTLVKGTQNETDYKEVVLELKKILGANIDYAEVLLEQEAANLDRYLAMMNEELSILDFNIDRSKANSVRNNVIAQANSWYELVLSQLEGMRRDSVEARAEADRRVDTLNTRADVTEAAYDTRVEILEDKINKTIGALNYTPRRGYVAELDGDRVVFVSEYNAFRTLSRAALSQQLIHTISS